MAPDATYLSGLQTRCKSPFWQRPRPPSFMLSSTTPSNPIIAQRSFHGSLCLPSYWADMRIKDPAVLLARLNDILGTVYSFHSTPALKDIMLDCISKGYDLGMAYGMLRRWWYHPPCTWSDLLSHLESLENRDRERREAAVVNGLIKDVRMPPRRIWDLYSNRVLPFWAVGMSWSHISTCGDIGAVSHAWMSPGLRIDKDTPINGHQWPVPIPRDIDLDDLRIELLNLQSLGQIEYAWLDVLCLRQKGGPLEEQLLAKEWETDVPTTGTIYEQCLFTVLYLNGLGRPFEENDLDDARHWCNRAWTVQEWCCGSRGVFSGWDSVVGGITEQSPRFELSTYSTRGYCNFTKRLEVRMNGPEASKTNIIKAAAMMSRRQAEREVDRLAGLAYLACGETQPVFDATILVDDVWPHFIDCMTPVKRWQLFFLFPFAGDHDYKWAPSWSQLLRNAEALVANAGDSLLVDKFSPLGIHDDDDEYCPTLPTALDVSRKHARLALQGKHSPKDQNGMRDYSCLVICLPNCRLDGFDSPELTSVDAAGRKIRRGTASFYVQPHRNISFNLITCHCRPIPSGRYCLIATCEGVNSRGSKIRSFCCWAVGWLDKEERFHKISVLEVENERAPRMDMPRAGPNGTFYIRHVLNEELVEELKLAEEPKSAEELQYLLTPDILMYDRVSNGSNPWLRRVKLA